MREPKPKDVFCPMCGASVPARSVTSPHPEAPEMVQFYPYAWVGLTTTGMVVVCSDACVQELLKQ